MIRIRFIVIVLLALSALALRAQPTNAADQQIADCTFATLQADLQSGGDWYYAPGQCTSPIVFTGTISMPGSSASLTAKGNDITLNGSGIAMFDMRVIFGAAGGHLALTGLTVQNGDWLALLSAGDTVRLANSSFSHFYSGVLDQEGGDVTISNCTFSNDNGEVIRDAGIAYGSDTISGSTFSNNSSYDGGVIYDYFDTVSISDSIFSNNNATYAGGAIENREGALTISDSTFSGNTAGVFGGAIYNDGVGPAVTTINDSTFSGNTAADGGALFNQIDQVYGNLFLISNSTFTGNRAVGGPGEAPLYGDGGAIFNWSSASISNSTVYGNSAVQAGNQIDNADYLEIGGTIIGGSPGGGLDCSNDPGSGYDLVASKDYNLEEDPRSSCFIHGSAAHDIIGQDPRLDPSGLQSNGGPTQTIALERGSPAIDAIPTSYTPVFSSTPLCPTTDQRGTGYPRPDDGESSCDIGASESSYPILATSLTAVSGSGLYGATGTLTATLTAARSSLAGETVSFTLNGAPVCGGATGVTCPITDGSGVATLQNVSLAGINAGSYATAVGAAYAGNASYTGSSASGALTVTTAAQTITVTTHAPASAPYNGSFTVAATASSGLAVTYSSSGSCSNSGATFTITSSSGACTVAYDQAGNGNFNPAAEVTETVNAQKANQTISFGTLPSRTYGDPPFTVSATATSGLPVSFSATGPCTVAQDPSTGTWTVSITGVGLGSSGCIVTGSQTGNDYYNAAPAVSQSFWIYPTITIDKSSLSATYDGNPHYATATTNPSGLSYSIFYEDSAGGDLANPVNAGVYLVEATIPDPRYGANFPIAIDYLTIAKASQTISFNALLNHAYGNAPFTVSATASSGLPVSFSVGSTDQCTIAGNTVTITGTGSCTVTASQSGNGNYTAATSVSQTFSIAKAATTTGLTSSASTSVFGQAVTFTATVAPATATGTVQFKVDGANSGSPVPLTGGSATLTTSALAVGPHTISAVYSGDSNFLGSTASALTQTVNQAATTTSVVSSVSPSLLKQAVTFTATIAAVAPGSGTPGGTVTFMDGTTTLGTGTLNASGIATFTTTALVAGTHSITASYAGSASFKASTSSAVSQQVRYTVKVLSSSGLTIVLQLLDANNANVSASNRTVTAECVVPYSPTAPTTCGPTPVQTITKAFGFVNNYKGLGAAFSYSVNPHGLTSGQQYDLLVQADGDPIWHAVPFTD